jgi:hypothetical protein
LENDSDSFDEFDGDDFDGKEIEKKMYKEECFFRDMRILIRHTLITVYHTSRFIASFLILIN